jgi:Holliday junction resolvase RusA-like endonuclease
MTDAITIRLAGVPKGKGRPRFSRASGRAYTPEATRSYEGALRYAAQQVMGDRAPLEGPLFVDMVALFPIPASWSKAKRAAAYYAPCKPDADNLAKVLDALNEVVFKDDKQVVALTLVKMYSDAPALQIKVRSGS